MRFYLAALLVLLAPLSAMADVKIATVNVQQVLKDSSAAKSASEQLESMRNSFKSQFTSTEDQLRNEDQELAKQRSALSQDAFQQKQQDFKKKVMEKTKDFEQKRSSLDRAYAKAMSDIQQKILEVAKGLAEAEGYDIVVPTSQILYAKADMDITSKVSTKLNSDLPSLTVDVSASGN